MKPLPNSGIPALFVSHQGHLGSRGGGVQICTREYFETLQSAGFALSPVEVPFDRRLLIRARHRIWPNPYQNFFHKDGVLDLLKTQLKKPVEYIFLNQRSLAPLARPLRDLIPQSCQIVLLSHGLESVDYLHKLRLDATSSKLLKLHRLLLGELLFEETEHSRYLEHIFCLSPFEVEIERWLGARTVTYLPRTITAQALEWRPYPGRLGFVGSIGHPPNAEGLVLFLEALTKIAPPYVHIRLVGGPAAAAKAIAKRFPLVTHLGDLFNGGLEREACTWSCFVHPLFCYSRGCSTKLAVALGWQIPVVTTPMGCRGYSWRQGQLPLANDPDALASLALQMLEAERGELARSEICKIVRSSPTLAEVAALIRRSLSLPGTGHVENSFLVD